MTNISDSEKAYHRCMMNHKESISRCSKLFYTISRCYFYIESTFSGASISFVLSHIARYVPSPEENSCIPITHFQCKNNFEHLLNILINASKSAAYPRLPLSRTAHATFLTLGSCYSSNDLKSAICTVGTAFKRAHATRL